METASGIVFVHASADRAAHLQMNLEALKLSVDSAGNPRSIRLSELTPQSRALVRAQIASNTDETAMRILSMKDPVISIGARIHMNVSVEGKPLTASRNQFLRGPGVINELPKVAPGIETEARTLASLRLSGGEMRSYVPRHWKDLRPSVVNRILGECHLKLSEMCRDTEESLMLEAARTFRARDVLEFPRVDAPTAFDSLPSGIKNSFKAQGTMFHPNLESDTQFKDEFWNSMMVTGFSRSLQINITTPLESGRSTRSYDMPPWAN